MFFKLNQLIAKYFLRTVFPLFIKFKRGGFDNLEMIEESVIFAANHSSYLDSVVLPIFLPWRLLPVRSMTNRRFFKQPAGILIWLLGGFPIRRKQDDINKTLAKPLKLLKKKQHIVIFPAGKISVSGGVQKAYRGVAHLAKERNVAVVPVVIQGTYKILKKMKIFGKRPVVRIYYGRPMYIKDTETQEEFAGRVMDQIREYMVIIG